MATWAEMINLVFRDSGVLGVGRTLQAQDTTDAKLRINMMLSQWKRRRWLVFQLVDLSITMNGSLFYTIGAGGQINAPRPDKIASAYVRQTVQSVPNQVDYPLRIVYAYEEYSALALKNMSAGPSWLLFYDSGWPLGKLYAWPLAGPSPAFDLHIQVKNELTSVGDLSEEINLPPEYELAIYANQMKMTRSAYRLPPDREINGLAKASLATLRETNFQIPTLGMPTAVQARGAYSIWSDSWGPYSR